MFQTSVLFKANYESTFKINVNQGGTSSGKTYSILQVLFIIACERPRSRITVVGQDIPNLKKGAIRDAETIVHRSPELLAQIKSFNKSDRIYTFHNGSWIEFNSYDNEQDAKSGKRDYLFVNEANGIDKMIYFQLAIRTTTRIWIDYNPTAKFWVHEELIGRPDVRQFISDHRHNPFLTQAMHDAIENIPDVQLWRVYARGLTGQIHGLIYPNFKLIEDFPLASKSVYGLDFGYNHKTALIEIGKQANRLIWNELIYQTELTIGDLVQLMKPLNIGKRPIYADHAAPDKIEDLKRAGFNVIKADKDVTNGIDFVKRNHLYVTRSSTHIRKELLSYKWDERKGKEDKPVKFNDDAMDAGRYGSYTHFRKDRTIKVSTNNSDWEDTPRADYTSYTNNDLLDSL